MSVLSTIQRITVISAAAALLLAQPLLAQVTAVRLGAFRAALLDPSLSRKIDAAQEIAACGAAAASVLPQLLRASIDAEPRPRIAADAAIHAIGDSAIPYLIDAFADPDPYINGTAARCVARVGRTAIPVLSRALESDSPNVRRIAAIALSHMGPAASAATPALIRALEDSSALIRWTCCYALRNIGRPARASVEALLRKSHDPDNDVRRAAAGALVAIDPASLRTSPPRDAVIAAIDTMVPRLMGTLHVPGVSVTVIYDRRIAWSRSFGVADVSTRTPVTPRTMFEACSMTKPVFAYSVLALAQEGRIDLDRPLIEYLPGLFHADSLERRDITARMVLNHTTGFPNWRIGEDERDGPLPVFARPGSRFGYSGEGMFYLQQAVEHILGEPLEAYARRTLFVPLGMAHTSYVWTEAFDADIAAGHTVEGAFLQKTRYVHANAAYTLYVTAEDYARFICAILAPDRSSPHLLWAGMVRTMLGHSVGVFTRDPILRPGRAFGTGVFWGLGWSLNATPIGDIAHHSGSNRSGFRCFAQFHPAEGTGIVIMTNGSNGSDLWEQIIREVGDL